MLPSLTKEQIDIEILKVIGFVGRKIEENNTEEKPLLKGSNNEQQEEQH